MGISSLQLLLLVFVGWTSGQPTYRFEKLMNTIEEDDEFVEVCIVREGTLEEINNTDTVTVEGTSSDGQTVASGDMDVGDSMAESSDFGDPKNVTFPPLSDRECINFDIIPDDEDEEEEEFQLILTSALQGVQNSTSIVVIRDMDGDMIGDPLFTVPVEVPHNLRDKVSTKRFGLCYEVHGTHNEMYNLVSDYCVSVNTRLTLATNPEVGNIMSEIAILAVDDEGLCHHIHIELYSRSVTFDGETVTAPAIANGVTAKWISTTKLRVAVPNCNKDKVIFLIGFDKMNHAEMLRFTIAKGTGLSQLSHGLMGQLWNVKMDFTPLHFPSEEGHDDEEYFKVTIHSLQDGVREFQGNLHPLTWNFKYKHCVYGGNRQGYPVIEGKAKEYRVMELFSIDYKYSQFSTYHCGN